MAFPLFLALNFVFFIRPDDLFPALAESRLYLWTFVICTLFSWRELSLIFKYGKLLSDPITCCILLYGLVFTVSNVMNVGLYEARVNGSDYLKLTLYYLLFLSLINTPARLHFFLKALVINILLMTVVVLLNHYEMIHVEAIKTVMQNEYDYDGTILDTYPRLCYLGTFEDPNDLSMILGVGMILCVCLYATGRSLLKVLWGLPLIAFGFLLILTQSRGGLLGLAVAVGVFFASRLGWRKALPLAGLAIAALLVIAGGRQANFSLSGGTGQDRLRIWSDGLTLMAQPRSFLIGIGVDQYKEEIGYVAHNSYVHAFVETGLVGGIIFSGMFLMGFGMVYRLRSSWLSYRYPVLAQMAPYVLAVLADYLVCMFSLSRNYVVTTFMMLALCNAFVRMAHRALHQPSQQMNFRMISLICGLGLGVFVMLKLFLMSFVHFDT